jgi:hypothetical protein
MSETLFIFFFLLFLLFFLKSFISGLNGKKQAFFLSRFFLAGLFLGCASLIRAVGHYLMLLALLLLVCSAFSFREKIRISLVLGILWLCVVSPWLLRNFLCTGALFFHTLPGNHFLMWPTAYVLVNKHNYSLLESQKLVSNEWAKNSAQKEASLDRKINDYERCVIAESIFLTYFKKHPLLMIKHFCINIIKSCFSFYSSWLLCIDTFAWKPYKTFFGLSERIKNCLFPLLEHKWFIIFIWFEFVPAFLLGLGFLGTLYQALFDWHLWPVLAKILPIMALFIFITLGYGCARLRLPIEPFLIILGVRFWVSRMKRYA